MSSHSCISVIVPTLASAARSSYIDQALASIVSQDEPAVPIVVANGDATDRDVLERLACRKDLRFIRSKSTTLPDALRVGREAVDTPYFSELDDDDELWPGALSSRLVSLRENEGATAVISNTILRSSSGECESLPDREAV